MKISALDALCTYTAATEQKYSIYKLQPILYELVDYHLNSNQYNKVIESPTIQVI